MERERRENVRLVYMDNKHNKKYLCCHIPDYGAEAEVGHVALTGVGEWGYRFFGSLTTFSLRREGLVLIIQIFSIFSALPYFILL